MKMAKFDGIRFIASAIKHYYRVHNIDSEIMKTWIDDALEEQGFEYKNGEIVEICNSDGDESSKSEVLPKYKVGDWLVHYCGNIFKVVDVRDDGEYLVDYAEDGLTGICKESELESQCRLWELSKDAKPGDLLSVTYASPDGKETHIVMLKELDNENCVCGYEMTLHRGLEDELVIDEKRNSFYYIFYYVECSAEMSNEFRPADKTERNIFYDFMMKNNLIWSEKKKDLVKCGEQENESNLHIGDWVLDVRTKEPFYLKKMTSVDTVKVCTITGMEFIIQKSIFLKFNRKWKISDAVDGDILADKSGNIFKFKKLMTVDRCEAYYFYDRSTGTVVDDSRQVSTDGVIPANAQERSDFNSAFAKFKIEKWERNDASSILLSIKNKLFELDKTVREDDSDKDEVKQWIDDALRKIDTLINIRKEK